MTYTLCIVDENNNTQRWWLNFLLGSLSIPPTNVDVVSRLQPWGARVIYTYENGYNNTIIFNTKQDMVWFLLRWT